MFCRHNRLTGKCPICRKELEAELPKMPPRTRRPATGGGAAARRPASAGSARPAARKSPGRLVTRKLARAADDGYRNPLVPGLRATQDAERLGMALTEAAARLLPPGPHPEVATEPDREEALWLAFLLALTAPDEAAQGTILAEHPSWASGEDPGLDEARRRTARAYRAWAARAGSQAAAFAGEPAWTPQRRFSRLFERLSLPGFGRDRRFVLLTTVAAAELYPLQADALHFGAEDDATTMAAKRLLVSGDRMLLERRARELAGACGLPLSALDRGLAVWGERSSELQPGGAELPAEIRRALKLP